MAGVGHTLNGSAGIAAVGICFWNQNCAATAPSWQPAAAFSSKPSFAAADQCGFERSFGPPQSRNHLIHVSFLPALEPHLRMNSARFWQLNSWVPLQRDVLYEGRIRGTSEQISCYQALDDCVYFFAQPGRHTKNLLLLCQSLEIMCKLRVRLHIFCGHGHIKMFTTCKAAPVTRWLNWPPFEMEGERVRR